MGSSSEEANNNNRELLHPNVTVAINSVEALSVAGRFFIRTTIGKIQTDTGKFELYAGNLCEDIPRHKSFVKIKWNEQTFDNNDLVTVKFSLMLGGTEVAKVSYKYNPEENAAVTQKVPLIDHTGKVLLTVNFTLQNWDRELIASEVQRAKTKVDKYVDSAKNMNEGAMDCLERLADLYKDFNEEADPQQVVYLKTKILVIAEEFEEEVNRSLSSEKSESFEEVYVTESDEASPIHISNSQSQSAEFSHEKSTDTQTATGAGSSSAVGSLVSGKTKKMVAKIDLRNKSLVWAAKAQAELAAVYQKYHDTKQLVNSSASTRPVIQEKLKLCKDQIQGETKQFVASTKVVAMRAYGISKEAAEAALDGAKQNYESTLESCKEVRRRLASCRVLSEREPKRTHKEINTHQILPKPRGEITLIKEKGHIADMTQPADGDLVHPSQESSSSTSVVAKTTESENSNKEAQISVEAQQDDSSSSSSSSSSADDENEVSISDSIPPTTATPVA